MILPSAAAVVPGLLLAFGLIPARTADSTSHGMRHAVTTTALLALIVAIACAIAVLPNGAAGTIDWVAFRIGGEHGPAFGVLIDGLSSLLFLTVSFIGWIIARFSIRYLDGDPKQGRFMRNLALTLGAVMLLVLSRNMLMFTAAWILSSTGLHLLLTHTSRHRAVAAARKKFVISRFGDLLLIAAMILTVTHYGSFEFAEILSAAKSTPDSIPNDPLIAVISCLLVTGAMTKSAQFPFHSWLPETLEIPTPVSALMHAGLINAGGILVIRMSPLIVQSHLALDCLTVIGTATALIGSVAMMTQPTVKKALAYSTVAQMGFMMLQCGLGAFSAALLHILGHSLYKAHAFLSSGSAIESAASMRTVERPAMTPSAQSALLLAAVAYSASIGLTIASLFHVNLAVESGAVVLTAVLTMAVAQLNWKAMLSRELRVIVTAAAVSPVVYSLHFLSFRIIESAVSDAVAHGVNRPYAVEQGLIGVVMLGFLSLLFLQLMISTGRDSRLLRALYVHASHGFYFDIFAHRITAGISRRIFGDRTPDRTHVRPLESGATNTAGF
ncbi:MAG: proton-conducting transporter membrane subunit [Pirellulales bacterium]